MPAIDTVLSWLRCGPATAAEIHEKIGDSINIRTVGKSLRALEVKGLAKPEGDARNEFRVWTLVEDPEYWRSVKWMCGQPQLRASELYGTPSRSPL